ncbi:flagellar biosynthesis protein FlgB [Thermostilla marina]
MLDGLFSGTTVPILEEVVRFNQARHTVLAGNIANMDTPGYKARDLDKASFQAHLKEMIEARHRPVSRYGSNSSIGRSTPSLSADEHENPKTILRHDGAKVGIEYEVTEMVKNQLEHNTALAIMTSQFRLLLTAISERV